mmetsp:Transcript_46601/g.51933  ORF Transcript_46601/g.51933 Transcript_46601/m.51933 type:complete len:81 (-) Transcript_46601:153-395(-)
MYKDDEDDSYNDDGIGDIFRNNDLALRQTNSNEDYDDDDDPWVLTDVTRFVNTRKGGGIDQGKRTSIVPIQPKAREGEGR